MPSRPGRQACAQTVGPSASMCSLNRVEAFGIASSIDVVVLARQPVPEHESGKGGSFAEAKAIINLLEMDLHCALRNVQLVSHLFIGESLGDKQHDLALSSAPCAQSRSPAIPDSAPAAAAIITVARNAWLMIVLPCSVDICHVVRRQTGVSPLSKRR